MKENNTPSKAMKSDDKLYDWSHDFGTRKRAAKYYTVCEKSYTYYEKRLLSECENKRVLEYGCGAGSYAFSLAQHGAHVTGIDISEEAIEAAQQEASAQGLDIRFRVMDAHKMEFEDDSFDIVCGTAILHHLDLEKALLELKRVLKKDGQALFHEPMGHNPAINLYRKLTPDLRVEDEHPLTYKDVKNIKKHFKKADFNYFSLFSLCVIPFRRMRIFGFLLKIADFADKILFKIVPFLKLMAWQVIITVEQPEK